MENLSSQTPHSNGFGDDLCLLQAPGAAAWLAWPLVQLCLRDLHFRLAQPHGVMDSVCSCVLFKELFSFIFVGKTVRLLEHYLSLFFQDLRKQSMIIPHEFKTSTFFANGIFFIFTAIHNSLCPWSFLMSSAGSFLVLLCLWKAETRTPWNIYHIKYSRARRSFNYSHLSSLQQSPDLFSIISPDTSPRPVLAGDWTLFENPQMVPPSQHELNATKTKTTLEIINFPLLES